MLRASLRSAGKYRGCILPPPSSAGAFSSFFPHCLFDARLTGNLQIRISTRVGSAPSLPPFLAAAEFQTENVGSSCDDAEDGCWGVSQACSVRGP